MDTNISILAEIPEDLHISLKGYLNQNPDWDQDRVFSAALSLFLLQNTPENTPESSQNYRRAARVYLETLFRSHDASSSSLMDISTIDCATEQVNQDKTSTVSPVLQTELGLMETTPTVADLVDTNLGDLEDLSEDLSHELSDLAEFSRTNDLGIEPADRINLNAMIEPDCLRRPITKSTPLTTPIVTPTKASTVTATDLQTEYSNSFTGTEEEPGSSSIASQSAA